MRSTPASDSLSYLTLDRVLRSLGIDSPPGTDLAGLGELYRAWCSRIPFDNTRKMIALQTGNGPPLPGIDAEDFFQHWLAHGTGGTCWPTSNALFVLLRSLGFKARRIAGSMRDLGVANHGSVKVKIDDRDWLVDSSMLTNLPIAIPGETTTNGDPVFTVEVEPVDGTHVVWCAFPPNTEMFPCRLLMDDVDHTFYVEGYESSRSRGAFNQRLYARRNYPGEMRVLSGNMRYSKTVHGLSNRELSRDEVCAALREDIGLSSAFIESWVRSGSLEASLEPPSGPNPPIETRRPPSQPRKRSIGA